MHRKRKLQGHAWDRVWMCDEWRMRGRVATCRVPWDCVDFDYYLLSGVRPHLVFFLFYFKMRACQYID
jgi:hypothetical protein